ncbi:MAG: NAD(+) salvage pathway protein [Vezdaea acicularis]|nr:MAG: NAD(+) salvage pathway protein [Vezdaea acicularis]
MTSQAPSPFIPALIIVDVQEDFCPPHGSLAVPHGRAILPTITSLLSLPFALKVATKDFHPPSHISFASNHPAPDNTPFLSQTTIVNPYNPAETYSTRLWPVHCVQGTPGADLLAEIDGGKVDVVVEKGMDPRVEMYSAFTDPFEKPSVSTSGLEEALRGRGVTHVYVVGLALDYCVRATALDARRLGWEVLVVREGTRPVDVEGGREAVGEMEGCGVRVVGEEGEEVGWVRGLEGRDKLGKQGYGEEGGG